jgi:hypothetical protein
MRIFLHTLQYSVFALISNSCLCSMFLLIIARLATYTVSYASRDCIG